MSSGEERGRSEEERSEDQATNEIGYRNVDEEGEYDEAGGRQGDAPPAGEDTER